MRPALRACLSPRYLPFECVQSGGIDAALLVHCSLLCLDDRLSDTCLHQNCHFWRVITASLTSDHPDRHKLIVRLIVIETSQPIRQCKISPKMPFRLGISEQIVPNQSTSFCLLAICHSFTRGPFPHNLAYYGSSEKSTTAFGQGYPCYFLGVIQWPK